MIAETDFFWKLIPAWTTTHSFIWISVSFIIFFSLFFLEKWRLGKRFKKELSGQVEILEALVERLDDGTFTRDDILTVIGMLRIMIFTYTK